MILVRSLAVAAASLMLHGCLAGLPPQESAGNTALFAEQVRLAEQGEADGDVPRALFHWQVAATLAPGEGRVAENLKRLRVRRQTEATRLREAGTRHLSRGRTRNARRALLQALALDPFHRSTLEHLRGLERRRLERQMIAKVARSREALDSRQAASPGLATTADANRRSGELKYLANEMGDLSTQPPAHRSQRKERVQQHLRDASDRFGQGRFDAALQALAQAEELAGNDPDLANSVRSLRREYAERLYASGIRLASSDPYKARDFLRQTLRFEPRHAKAAVRIRRLALPQP